MLIDKLLNTFVKVFVAFINDVIYVEKAMKTRNTNA